MIIQHVVLGSDDVAPPSAPPHATDAKPYVCLNPCQAIPYRPRSPAEQDVINAYQAIEKARVAHDANEWAKHVTDDFVVYGSGQPPNPKAHRVTAIRQQNETPAGATVGEVQTMRIWVYGDAAAMTATYVMPDQSRPNFRAARVWLKRNGQWLMAISQQTDIK
jgi:ketosteroid isomerase-like protein